jgi:hypothetical protein
MKFPVFLLGLIVSSVGIGIFLWLGGVSTGKSMMWALVAFGIGQLLYVALVAVLAASEKRSRPAAPKAQETGSVRGLAPEQDRHV